MKHLFKLVIGTFTFLIIGAYMVKQYNYDLIEGSIKSIASNETEFEVNEKDSASENSMDDLGPSFSPDGRKIAFYSARQGNGEEFRIYTVNVDGSELKKLAYNDSSGYHTEPIWSLDGTQIAYTNFKETGSKMMLMDSDGKNARELQGASDQGFNLFSCFDVSGKGYFFVHWSADGFTPDIYHLKDSKLTRITHDGINTRPQLVNKKILYFAKGIDFVNSGPTIHKMDLETKVVKPTKGLDSYFPAITGDCNVYTKNTESTTTFYIENLEGQFISEVGTANGNPAQFMSLNLDKSFVTYHIPGKLGNDIRVMEVETGREISITEDK